MLRQTLTAAIVATAFWAMASGCERAPVNSVGSPSGTGSAALFSFESLEEVARVVKTDVPPEAQKSFSVERSAEHATEGAFCLKVSFPTEGWDPGIVLEDVPKD